ncbi:MAG: alpha/beta fold hydrolase [Planctomycetota bacterium]|nr:alpha/beta fold hydrolase [Planctomycetota bacterium]
MSAEDLRREVSRPWRPRYSTFPVKCATMPLVVDVRFAANLAPSACLHMVNSQHFPPFQTHPLVRGGHVQTLAAVYLPGPRYAYNAVQHRVTMDDGDVVVLHDDCPPGWQPTDRIVLLMHGLSGSYQSNYMQRIAGKLHERNVRSFRMDLRGCGAGVGLAKMPYHSGRSEDVATALRAIAQLAPGAPVTIVGFSLSGNVALKLLGELGTDRCEGLDSAVAVCPPLDLAACSHNLHRLSNKVYDKHFLSCLMKDVMARERALPVDERTQLSRKPKRLFDFDDVYTAPVSGFGSADNYYRTCSSAQFVPGIRLPTLVIAANNDPMIPHRQLLAVDWPECADVHITHGGGHLGFIGRPGVDPDCRWMDWRVIEWVQALPTATAVHGHVVSAPAHLRHTARSATSIGQ